MSKELSTQIEFFWQTPTQGQNYTLELLSFFLPLCESLLLTGEDSKRCYDFDEVLAYQRNKSLCTFQLTFAVCDFSFELVASLEENLLKLSFSESSFSSLNPLLPLSRQTSVCSFQHSPEYRCHLPFITFFLEGGALHAASLNSLVLLAKAFTGFESATFSVDREAVCSWHTEQGAGVPLYHSSTPGYLDEHTASQPSGLNFQNFIESEGNIEETIPQAPEELAQFLAQENKNHQSLSEVLSQATGFKVSIPVVGDDFSAEFLLKKRAQDVLVIKPLANGLEVYIDFSQGEKDFRNTIHYALAHILLAHTAPGDGHTFHASIAQINDRRPIHHFDRDIENHFGHWIDKSIEQVKSLEECTPKDKATLGLHAMMNKLLGGGGRLHAQTAKYKAAAYQRQAAQRLVTMLENYGGGMLCDGVGLGKTYVATTAMIHYCNEWLDRFEDNPEELLENPFRITILSPNSVVSTWENEALPSMIPYGVNPEWVRVISHSKLSKISRNSQVLNQSAPGKLSDIEHLLLSDLVILDEAHNFRSLSARRTLVLRDLLRLQPRQEMQRRTLLLTATPINNSLQDLEQQVSLMFSEPIPLSDARTESTYRKHTLESIAGRAQKARLHKTNADLSSLLIHGKLDVKFSQALQFRGDLHFGEIHNLGKYLKDQDKKLAELQDEIRASVDCQEDSDEPQEQAPQTRIAAELLDRIVVQRSRNLCKEIETQENSGVHLLFRADAGEPEKLSYQDSYDGTAQVLERFLPLFDKAQAKVSDINPISFKVYMWYDIKMGFKKITEASPAVGLQKVLVLKRLESSPVSFLISLLRLTVFHAYQLRRLQLLCRKKGQHGKENELLEAMQATLENHSDKALSRVRWLSLGDEFQNVRQDFYQSMSEAYASSKISFQLDEEPVQLDFFQQLGEETEDEQQLSEELTRLWELKDLLLQDLNTLLSVTPELAQIVFHEFDKQTWPPNFIATNKERNWPDNLGWALRLIHDPKIKELIIRLLKARRQNQKVIVFSQFTDSLYYVESVLRACQHLKVYPDILSGLGLPDVTAEELAQLINETEIVTGDTEERDDVVNRFAPYYRIGPHAPSLGSEDGSLTLQEWKEAWIDAAKRPINVIFATDVLAEGVNLQDAAVLINFDIHWNPVKMIQRSGRIDRRLNPHIEDSKTFPDLDFIEEETIHFKAPQYYWHQSPQSSPLIVNMILPDELEEELSLREKISQKTLAIDVTLGLERGTGAEAEWMSNYKYHGISSLNDFDKDRAIEQLASVRNSFSLYMQDRGIESNWLEEMECWLYQEGATLSAPLISRASIGREGREVSPYFRYLQPKTFDGVPHWLWNTEYPSEMLNFWLRLDGEGVPADTHKAEADFNDSRPMQAEDLLKASETVIHDNGALLERNFEEIIDQVYQGMPAISAGYFDEELDREEIDFEQLFIFQFHQEKEL